MIITEASIIAGAEATRAIANASAERDKTLRAAMDSDDPDYRAWGKSELELRKNGNDFLSDAGALPRWIVNKAAGAIEGSPE